MRHIRITSKKELSDPRGRPSANTLYVPCYGSEHSDSEDFFETATADTCTILAI